MGIPLSKLPIFTETQGKVTTNYKVSRKDAFAETSNLSSAFQRNGTGTCIQTRIWIKIMNWLVLNHKFSTSLAHLAPISRTILRTEAR